MTSPEPKGKMRDHEIENAYVLMPSAAIRAISGDISIEASTHGAHMLALFVQIVIVVGYVCRLTVLHKARYMREHIPDTRASSFRLHGTFDLERRPRDAAPKSFREPPTFIPRPQWHLSSTRKWGRRIVQRRWRSERL